MKIEINTNDAGIETIVPAKKVNIVMNPFMTIRVNMTAMLHESIFQKFLKIIEKLFPNATNGLQLFSTIYIFDSNMTTIITCIILYVLGTSIVKGFALTLAIGVLVSMFSAITVTKNFMHLMFGTGELKHPALFGLKQSDIQNAFVATETKKEKAKFGVLD